MHSKQNILAGYERTFNILGWNWSGTAPITSLKMTCKTGALMAGSTYRLYGKGPKSGGTAAEISFTTPSVLAFPVVSTTLPTSTFQVSLLVYV